jgi:hypothetical protein
MPAYPSIVQLRGAYKLPPLGSEHFFHIPFCFTNSDVLHLTIAGLTGKVFLPHLEKKNQPLL